MRRHGAAWGGIVQIQDSKAPRGRSYDPGAADDGTVDMAQSTDRAAADQALDGLTAEARAAVDILPPIADCERLDRDLRAAIRELADQVRTQMRYLPSGGIDWSRHDTALLAAQATLLDSLGNGLRSAARQVAELGKRVAELREIAGR